MRRGAVTTSRALVEQSAAGEQISRAASALQQLVTTVTTGMLQQTSRMNELASAADGMRTQSEQASRALKEQSQAMRGMTSAVQNAAGQIKLITTANKEHSTVATALSASVGEIREITDRHIAGVKQTRGDTTELLRRAEVLSALVDRPGPARRSNGRPQRSSR
jgi:methyl-accepting chemotaxis protein